MTTFIKFKDNFVTKVRAYPNLVNYAYLFSLGVFIFASLIKETKMLNEIFSQRMVFWMEAIPAFIVYLKIAFFDDNDIKDIIIFSVFECYLYLSSYIAASVVIFYLVFFVYGAKNIKIENILKVFIIVNIAGTLLTMLLTGLNVIRNVRIIRNIYSPVVRYSIGMVYPTDFAARGLSVLLAYAAFKKFRLNLPEYISFGAVIIWFYIITRTRVDFALSILLIASLLFYPYLKKIFTKITPKMITILMYLYIVFIMGLGFLYTWDPHNKILELINHILSGRLTNNRLLILNYHVKFAGQYIYQPGGGSGFYIDSVFFRTLWMYGIPMFILFLGLIFILNKKFMHTTRFLPLELCFIIFMISGGLDQHFWDGSFNFIPLMLFANCQTYIKNNS